VIAAKVRKADLGDKYNFIACGVEDSELLRGEGVTEGSLDTVLSIQVLCAVGNVESVMREVWKLLKPGGSFVFWEHVKNKDTVTAVTQGTYYLLYYGRYEGANMRIACLNPAWSALVGCCINRDIKAAILAAGEWENPGDIEVTDEPYSVLPRISGVLKKKI
jgi:SAM-dependent methyltransferase